MTGSHISPRFSVLSYKLEGNQGQYVSLVLVDTFNQRQYSLLSITPKEAAAWVACREPVDPRDTLLKLYRIVNYRGNMK